MNDYWNTIMSAQGRGWGEWRPPSDSGPLPWSQQWGGGSMQVQPMGRSQWGSGGMMPQGAPWQMSGFSLGGGLMAPSNQRQGLWPMSGNLSMLGMM